MCMHWDRDDDMKREIGWPQEIERREFLSYYYYYYY